LAGEGDQNEGDRQSAPNPKQCPCGVGWHVNNASASFNARPKANDIAALHATIEFPNLGQCDGECPPRNIPSPLLDYLAEQSKLV